MNLFSLAVEAMAWSAFCIAIHALASRIGRAALLVVIGTLFVWLQEAALHSITVQGPGDLELPYSSIVLFPALLAAVLVVYAVDGAVETRRLMAAFLVLGAVYVGLREMARLAIHRGTNVELLEIVYPPTSLRFILASIAVLIADILILAIVFQAVSNVLRLRMRWVARALAAASALFVALMFDAVLFPLLASGSVNLLLPHLAGKALASISIGIVVGPYVAYAYRTDLASDDPRPSLSILKLKAQVEHLQSNLAASEQRFRLLIDALPDGALITRGDRVLYANRALARLFELSLEQVMTSRARDLLDLRKGVGDDSDAGLLYHVDIQTAAGKVREIEAHVRPVPYEGSGALLALLRDVSSRRDAEEALQQAQGLEILGALAGSLAHQFNNELASVLGFATLARREIGDGTPASECIESLIAAATTASQLSTRLLDFAANPALETVLLDPRVEIEAAVAMARPIIDERIAIRCELAADLPRFYAAPSRFRQMLIHLLLNARDAMPQCGGVTIRAQAVDRSTWPLGAPDDDQQSDQRDLLIEVIDEGVGIPDWALARIFDPLFSTKERKGGTGLGLAMVSRCVANMRGHITVESSEGNGAAFRIYIPGVQLDEKAGRVPSTPPPAGDMPSGLRVLYVDDEESLRILAPRLLAPLGLEVITACDGDDGLAIWRGGSHFDLVILDVIMPGIPVEQLFVEIRKAAPQIPVIFTSGYAGSLDERSIAKDGNTFFISKPFKPADLIEIVRHAALTSKT